MNVQVIAAPDGRLLWISSALPGAIHDIRAAPTQGTLDALAEVGVQCWADKRYQVASPAVRVHRRNHGEQLSTGQRAVNVHYVGHRAPSPSADRATGAMTTRTEGIVHMS